jgi:hypothetical protein
MFNLLIIGRILKLINIPLKWHQPDPNGFIQKLPMTIALEGSFFGDALYV